MATVLSDHSSHWPTPHGPTGMRDTAVLGLGLGELLRRARERRGLTLRDVSNETKIPVRHLDALERENLAAVPNGFYRRAEVRAYARAVHLDQDLALAGLARALEVPVKPEAQTRGVQLPTRPGRHVWIVVGVITAAALLGWEMWQRQTALAGDALVVNAIDSPKGHPTAAPPQPDSSLGTSQRTASDQVAPSPSAAGDAPATRDASPEALVAMTELVIATEPAGARVTVNGIGWGTAPITIRYLPPGEKRIRVSKDGYVSEDRLVHLGENQQRALDIRLRSNP